MAHRSPAGLAPATPWPRETSSRTWRTHPEGAFPPHLVLAAALVALALGGALGGLLSEGAASRLAGAGSLVLGCLALLAQVRVRRAPWARFERDFRAYVERL